MSVDSITFYSPFIYFIFSAIVKAFAMFRDDSESKKNLKESIYSIGIEVGLISLGIFLLQDIFVYDIYGLKTSSSEFTNMIQSTKYYTLFLTIFLCLSIMSYRCTHANSWLIKKLKLHNFFLNNLIRGGFLMLSLFFGYLSANTVLEIFVKTLKVFNI